MMDRAALEELREQYRKALLDDVVAFWERHSVDREFGGFVARTTSEPSFVGVRFALLENNHPRHLHLSVQEDVAEASLIQLADLVCAPHEHR